MQNEQSNWIDRLTRWGIPTLPDGDMIDNLVAIGGVADNIADIPRRLIRLNTKLQGYSGQLYVAVPSKKLKGWVVGMEWTDFIDALAHNIILRLVHMKPDCAARYIGLGGGELRHGNSGLSYTLSLKIGHYNFSMRVDNVVGSKDDASVISYSWCTFLEPAKRRFGGKSFDKIKRAFEEGVHERERALQPDTDVR